MLGGILLKEKGIPWLGSPTSMVHPLSCVVSSATWRSGHKFKSMSLACELGRGLGMCNLSISFHDLEGRSEKQGE